MKPYELSYLIEPSFTEKEAADYHESIKKSIEKEGGVLGSEQPPTQKNLAYAIDRKDKAYLSSVDFEAEKENISKIKEKMEKEDNVLRYLLITKQTLKEKVKRERRKEEAPQEEENKEEVEEKKPKKKKSLKPEKAKLDEIGDKIEEML